MGFFPLTWVAVSNFTFTEFARIDLTSQESVYRKDPNFWHWYYRNLNLIWSQHGGEEGGESRLIQMTEIQDMMVSLCLTTNGSTLTWSTFPHHLYPYLCIILILFIIPYERKLQKDCFRNWAVLTNWSPAIRINVSWGVRAGTTVSSKNQICTLVPQSHSRNEPRMGCKPFLFRCKCMFYMKQVF